LPPSSHRRGVYPEYNNHKLLQDVVPIHQLHGVTNQKATVLRVSTEYTVLTISTDSHY